MDRVFAVLFLVLILLLFARLLPLLVAVAFWRFVAGLAIFAVLVLASLLLGKGKARGEK